jgi:hypothetical protein
MEPTIYCSTQFTTQEIDFISPIKVHIRRKTLIESENGASDKSEISEMSLKSCLKNISTKTVSCKSSENGLSHSSREDGGESYPPKKIKQNKKVTFRSVKTNQKPLAEIIRVKSFRKENLKNTFVGVGINKRTEKEINNQIFCRCSIF